MHTSFPGATLLPTRLDELAQNKPLNVYGSMPRTTNLQDGFDDVNYKTLANAVNQCVTFLQSHVQDASGFEALAYVGPVDFRYSILAFAAMKTDLQVSGPITLAGLPARTLV